MDFKKQLPYNLIMKKSWLIGICVLIALAIGVGIYLITRQQGDSSNLSEPSGEQSISEPLESSGSSQSDSSYISSVPSSSENPSTPSVQSSQTSKPEADVPSSSSSETSSQLKAPLNINTATQEEFMTLPGIGEEQARLFVVYREQAGQYEKLLDLVKVKGMTQDKFNQIKDYITL